MRRLLALSVFLAGALHAENVLVLPFFNHTDSAGLEWIGESIAETVHDSLASEGVLALDRDDRLEAYRRLSLRPGAEITRASIIKIGDALDATQVIYGYYELLPAAGGDSKGSLRITARIMDLRRLGQGAPFSQVGALEDLARLEARLGWQALDFLRPKSAPSEEQFLRARPPVRIDAVENYIRGLLAQSPEQRHRLFTQAARLDDKYSQPCYQLGKEYWQKKEYRLASSWFDRVTRSDPHYLESRFLQGLCRYFTSDFKGAAQAFEEVAAAVPLNEVYNDLGAAQAQSGNLASAVGSYRKALEGDDADPDYHFNLGYALWRTGQFSLAADSFRAALARNPQDTEATTLLGFCLKQEGPRPGDARLQARQRIKTNYEESAYRQLQSELAK